jgi:hypothetical protein
MISWRRHAILFVLTYGLMLDCNNGGPLQAGSETTSGVEIEVVGSTIRGKTTPGALVMLFDARYVPGDSLKAVMDSGVADDSGRVAFADLPAGKYNVFIYPESLSQGAAMLGISVLENSYARYADTAQFASLRTITGTVTSNGNPDSLSQVFIAGSPFFAHADAMGKFNFLEVPVGVYTIVARNLVKWGPISDSVNVDLSQSGNAIIHVTLDLQ